MGYQGKPYQKLSIVGGLSHLTWPLRLSRAFNTTPDLWLNLQKNYDLWHAANDSKSWKSVKPIFYTSIPNLA
jgi:plasmid maintenance system antidote protein VapI